MALDLRYAIIRRTSTAHVSELLGGLFKPGSVSNLFVNVCLKHVLSRIFPALIPFCFELLARNMENFSAQVPGKQGSPTSSRPPHITAGASVKSVRKLGMSGALEVNWIELKATRPTSNEAVVRRLASKKESLRTHVCDCQPAKQSWTPQCGGQGQPAMDVTKKLFVQFQIVRAVSATEVAPPSRPLSTEASAAA